MNAPYDGNLLAGPLAEVFDMEVTSAIARCGACGRSTVVAELAVYGPHPGLVARCPGCGHPLLRLARTPTSVWLDLGGMSALRLPREQMISGSDDSALSGAAVGQASQPIPPGSPR